MTILQQVTVLLSAVVKYVLKTFDSWGVFLTQILKSSNYLNRVLVAASNICVG
jgi:hypothetical protein